MQTVAPKRLPKGLVKRQKIVLSAAKVFSVKGYSATKLTDIANEAGTQPGSLYYHFDSRDEIVREVLRASMDVIGTDVEEAMSRLPPDASFVQQLRIGIGAHLRAILADEPYMAAYNRIINEVPQGIRDDFKESPRRYAHFWHSLILAAQKRGELRDDLDPVLFRLLLFGSVTWSQLWFDPKGPRTVDDLTNAIVETFLYGALTLDDADEP